VAATATADATGTRHFSLQHGQITTLPRSLRGTANMLKQWGQETLNAIGRTFPGSVGDFQEETLVFAPFSITRTILAVYTHFAINLRRPARRNEG
jgi:hypothetical protein